MGEVARHVRVTGRVQGVFYRAWTREQAHALGVHGWVRNCPDGSVEAHAEGDEQAVEELVVRMSKTGHRWRNPVWRHADGSFAEW